MISSLILNDYILNKYFFLYNIKSTVFSLMEESPPSKKIKNMKAQNKKVYKKEEEQVDFFYESIISNEEPFRIDPDKLDELLHRSIGALTFLNKNKKLNAGSGTLISRNTILTCAHNIFDLKSQT